MRQRKTLRELRLAAQGADGRAPLSREELAVAVGTTYPTIVRLDQRKQTPRVDLAVRIARYFGVSVEEIDWEPVGKSIPAAA